MLRDIFSIQDKEHFKRLSLKTFRFQYENNSIYRTYCDLIGCVTKNVKTLTDIPFLPISFFKTNAIKSFKHNEQLIFESSGTTGSLRSKHHVLDLSLYQKSFVLGFEHFYGSAQNCIFLGLLPSYHQNKRSSLIYMVDHLINLSGTPSSCFLLDDFEGLIEITAHKPTDKKIVIFGVAYALLDLAEQYQPDLSECVVIETGGMKGRRKELTKTELHSKLKNGLNVKEIHSEYGMTELLSQAYSLQKGVFHCPPWMKVLIREHNDPFNFIEQKTGGINIIDLANIHSCSFIATQDLGRIKHSGFEVLGRFDNADIRGCNLLIQ